mmetsp:Transcript_7610/g.15824  ORF Transcript_7610/g.15824 Transcript_7610/m.15824 type:complete len:372 (+) Transcript_7610:721-1836(+)
MQEGVAPLHAREPRVELRGEVRRRRRVDEAPRGPEVGVGDDGAARADGAAVAGADARGASVFHEEFGDVGVELDVAPVVFGDAPDEGVDDRPGAALGVVQDDAGLVEVREHVGHERDGGVPRGGPLEEEADHVEPVPDEGVGDVLLVQEVREGHLQLRGPPGFDQHIRQRRQVPPHSQRHPRVHAHGRRRQPENSLPQRHHPPHEPLPLLPRVRPAARRQLPHKILRAHGIVQQRTLRQVRPPAVVPDPRGPLAHRVEHVRERVRRPVPRQARVQGRAGLETVAPDLPLVGGAAGAVVRLEDQDAEARGGQASATRQTADARTDDHHVVLVFGGGGAGRRRRRRRRHSERSDGSLLGILKHERRAVWGERR